MPAPRDISELADRFGPGSISLNEADVKAAFIEPTFTLLGWDLQDPTEVGRERSAKAGRPDYIFKTGNQLQFLVEAKRPDETLLSNKNHAYQLRRYAWNTDAPLSILTNFREFAVYDCRRAPRPTDDASTARMLFAGTPAQLKEKWKEIAILFSRNAVVDARSLDQFRTRRAGTQRVDEALLSDVEEWRKELAHDAARRNRLSDDELNSLIQLTIDRILFLRIAEDRGSEPGGQLKNLVDRRGVYRGLCYLFEQADQRYNSGLFHFQPEASQRSAPDAKSLQLQFSDDVLRRVLRDLYLPRCAYDFSVLPIEVLGKVYERFIGKEIKLTPAGDARVYDKPRIRKAGGVYYTPKWVVDYIVEKSVSPLLAGKTIVEVDEVRVLDPACGSGSFLIGAYQRLLDWYAAAYGEGPEDAPRKDGRVYRNADGSWTLSVPERKRILLRHIFGVDIDSQAVEVTKLSLLLKVLEGDADPQRRLFQERAMPDLGANIKCGNSLIELDFYRQHRLDGSDPMVNAFSYRDEFPSVFTTDRQGFDAVIGNPPYKGVAGRPGHSERIEEEEKEYFRRHFRTARVSQYDLYSLFLERAVQLSRARVGFIVPDGILARDLARPVREVILEAAPPALLTDAGWAFEEAETSNTILILDKERTSPSASERLDEKGANGSHPIDLDYFRNDPELRFAISIRPEDIPILDCFKSKARALIDEYSVSRGEEIGKRSLGGRGSVEILAGEDVAEFRIGYSGKRIPATSIEKDVDTYKARKLLVRQTASTLIVAYDTKGYATIKSLYNLVPRKHDPERDWAVCAILNSNLARFVFGKLYGYKSSYPQLNQNWVEGFPVRFPDGDIKASLARIARELAALPEVDESPKGRQAGRLRAALKRNLEAEVSRHYGLSHDQEMQIVQNIESTAH